MTEESGLSRSRIAPHLDNGEGSQKPYRLGLHWRICITVCSVTGALILLLGFLVGQHLQKDQLVRLQAEALLQSAELLKQNAAGLLDFTVLPDRADVNVAFLKPDFATRDLQSIGTDYHAVRAAFLKSGLATDLTTQSLPVSQFVTYGDQHYAVIVEPYEKGGINEVGIAVQDTSGFLFYYTNENVFFESLDRLFVVFCLYAMWITLSVGGCLFLLLSTPLKQIAHLSRLLPDLVVMTPAAHRGYNEGSLAPIKIKHEIDELLYASTLLTDQIGFLKEEFVERTTVLQAQSKALKSEKDFVSCLLDSAHAMILTQNSRCTITSMNRFGVALLGDTHQQYIGKSFFDLIPYDMHLPDLRYQFDELAKGIRNTLHHESELNNPLMNNRHMVWYHSKIPKDDYYGSYILTVALDVSQKKRAEEHLGWLSSHDALTGLMNRRRFYEKLDSVIQVSSRFEMTGAIFLINLDQFKDINDSSGHHVGDDVLKRVSTILKKYFDDSDTVARLGGDEFAGLMPEFDECRSKKIATHLCKSLSRLEVQGGGGFHKISASVGIVLFPRHGQNKEVLLARADIAMRHAKDKGRNGWHIFEKDEDRAQKVRDRIYWNEMVKRILEENSFEVHFQPIMNIKTKEVSHFEALLRLFQEGEKPISTQKLILSAENSGTIQELDKKVIEKVFARKADLESRGLHPKFSINLSGVSFRNKELHLDIFKLIDKYKVETKEIIFEITETAAMTNSENTRKIMNAIKGVGCRFSLDDFGVGFSSLYYLKQFPFDYVKIDGSFVRNITEDMDDQVMVKALVAVAKSFGQSTVAEFVETERAIDVLKRLGVDYAQGYFVGKPTHPENLWPISGDDKQFRQEA